MISASLPLPRMNRGLIWLRRCRTVSRTTTLSDRASSASSARDSSARLFWLGGDTDQNGPILFLVNQAGLPSGTQVPFDGGDQLLDRIGLAGGMDRLEKGPVFAVRGRRAADALSTFSPANHRRRL